MRAVQPIGRARSRLGQIVGLMMMLAGAACADLGTGPEDDARSRGPLRSDFCVPGADGKTFICQPIDSRTPPGPGQCDPAWWTPECGACMSGAGSGPELQGLASCPDGGDPGAPPPSGPGSGTGFVPPGEPPDTCATDDPTLNDRVVQAGFAELWLRSNPLAESQWERREQGAWIVRTAAGLEMVPWTDATSEPCRIVPHYGTFAIPANAVAWVHTHPFAIGEVQYTCEPDHIDENGNPVYARYNGFPNSEDMALAQAINDSLGRLIPAYTIDQGMINRFTATSELTTTGGSRYDRCGY